MSLRQRLLSHFYPEVMASFSYRRYPSGSGIVLMYHEVLPDDISLPAWTIIRESDFRWQMEFMSRHFDIVSIDQALVRMASNINNKRPFAVITFDDGYSGNLNTVLPLMKSLGLPFTVYPATKKIIDNNIYWFDKIISILQSTKEIELNIDFSKGLENFIIPKKDEKNRWKIIQKILEKMKTLTPKKREQISENIFSQYCNSKSQIKMLTEDELIKLSKSDCVTIGSHTHDHELLDQLRASEVYETIQQSVFHIERIIGVRPKHFSYPNGNYDQNTLQQIKNCGFETAVTTRPGRWVADNDLFQIPRIGIGRFETRSSFMARLSGWI